MSSAYHPHSNFRAETAFKTLKRLISDNVDKSGNLDNDAVAAALLTYRNTPDRDTNMSPAMILFARQLRSNIPCHPDKLRLIKEWIFTASQREQALAKRHLSKHSELLAKSKLHQPLAVGNTVQVQNQRGNTPK